MKGYKDGKILAPLAKQEGNNLGFRAISKWGRPKSSHYGSPKYPVDKDMLNMELNPKRFAKNGREFKRTLKMMHPSTFLKQCPTPEIFKDDQKYRNADECPSSVGYSKQKIDEYKIKIFKGEELPPLILDKRTGNDGMFKLAGHDGRHRAKAAYLAAVKRVPVIVVEDV